MATTVRDLVTDAAMAVGALGNAETLTDADAKVWLRTLVRLMDSWANDNLNCYEVYLDSLPCTAGVGAYSSSLLSQGRPVTVVDVYVRLSNVDYPISLINNQQFADIAYKTVNGIPDKCYIDTGYPHHTFNLFPQPMGTMTLYVEGTKLVSGWTLDTTVSLPPGYERMIVTNLACEGASAFGKTPSPSLLSAAADSHAIIKRQNNIMLELQTQTPIGRGLFNIYRGS